MRLELRPSSPLLTGLLAALALAACAEPPPTVTKGARAMEPWKQRVGRRVEVVGYAVNAKLGAQLQADGATLWMSGLSSWPGDIWKRGVPLQRVRVRGLLREDHELPVYELDVEGTIARDEPISQGIFVPPSPHPGDPEEAPPKPRLAAMSLRHRFVIVDHQWELLAASSPAAGEKKERAK
jgi:hypothetical protein